MRKKKKPKVDPKITIFNSAINRLIPPNKPLFEVIDYIDFGIDKKYSGIGLGKISSKGHLLINYDFLVNEAETTFVMASLTLMLCLGHHKKNATEHDQMIYQIEAMKYAKLFGFGKQPDQIEIDLDIYPFDFYKAKKILERSKQTRPFLLNGFAAALSSPKDRQKYDVQASLFGRRNSGYENLFARGMAIAAARSLKSNNEDEREQKSDDKVKTYFESIKVKVISKFPLIAAVATSLNIEVNERVCLGLDIQVAAVCASSKTLFFNPKYKYKSEAEAVFVMTHEIMHVALQHEQRSRGRDSYLWNIACDYVINGWLVEMHIGEFLEGGLLDPSLKGKSAEQIYDLIVKDMRKYRKLNTLRGRGQGDIISSDQADYWKSSQGVSLDEFYRNMLRNGFVYYSAIGRGTLPGNLKEEIKSLTVPPVPWDVSLAKWFDETLHPPEQKRTFSRVNRRQASTPDIPRAVRYFDEEDMLSHTFGIVIDTSSSMSKKELGKGLGAIASFAEQKECRSVRIICCDVAAHDMGNVSVLDVADRLVLTGRGGTKLQPGINLLENCKDFPKEAPILIVTDGFIEPHLKVSRVHGYLLTCGSSLYFKPKGEVFRI